MLDNLNTMLETLENVNGYTILYGKRKEYNAEEVRTIELEIEKNWICDENKANIIKDFIENTTDFDEENGNMFVLMDDWNEEVEVYWWLV